MMRMFETVSTPHLNLTHVPLKVKCFNKHNPFVNKEKSVVLFLVKLSEHTFMEESPTTKTKDGLFLDS